MNRLEPGGPEGERELAERAGGLEKIVGIFGNCVVLNRLWSQGICLFGKA